MSASDRFVLRIGHYRLGKTLGVGSFGKVKLAHHEITGHQVAVKIINKTKVKLMDMTDKVKREIQILKLLYHPHIIRLYEIIDTATDVFMIMEYVSGGELFDYIVQNGKLTEEKARTFFQQFVSGVEYIHAYNIVHRDLKPENLLLDSRNHLRIADFGLSNIMRDGDFLKTSCGSPNYAAPEVISGKLYAGAEVDVWSVGVILFALLCGRLPFDDKNIVLTEGRFIIPHHVSPIAADLIQRTLVIDPVKRITIDEIKAHPWYSVDLPIYLSVDPLSHTRDVKVIDEDVLREVLSKFGDVDREELVGHLSSGVMSKGAVMYHLVVDNNWRMEQRRKAKEEKKLGVDVPESLLSTSPPAALSPSHIRSEENDFLFEKVPMGSGLPGTTETNMDVDSLFMPRHIDQRWYLGISSSLRYTIHSIPHSLFARPSNIMLELCRVLKYLEYEWHVVTPYDLCVRPLGVDPRTHDAVESSPIAPSAEDGERKGSGILASKPPPRVHRDLETRLRVRLFQLSPERLVLDFTRNGGDLFSFCDVCAVIIDELDV